MGSGQGVLETASQLGRQDGGVVVEEEGEAIGSVSDTRFDSEWAESSM
jgi:hypothetical protein